MSLIFPLFEINIVCERGHTHTQTYIIQIIYGYEKN